MGVGNRLESRGGSPSLGPGTILLGGRARSESSSGRFFGAYGPHLVSDSRSPSDLRSFDLRPFGLRRRSGSGLLADLQAEYRITYKDSREQISAGAGVDQRGNASRSAQRSAVIPQVFHKISTGCPQPGPINREILRPRAEMDGDSASNRLPVEQKNYASRSAQIRFSFGGPGASRSAHAGGGETRICLRVNQRKCERFSAGAAQLPMSYRKGAGWSCE